MGQTAARDHNGFSKGNFYYMSNYQRGLTILDVTSPNNPSEHAFFDTYPDGDSVSYNGAWGTYPYLPQRHYPHQRYWARSISGAGARIDHQQ